MSEQEPQAKSEGIVGQSASTGGLGARPINCDQVAWILNAIERHLPNKEHPAVSRAREMQKYALLYELMEVAHLYFEDASAQHNGTPPDVRRFQYASKAAEAAAWSNAQMQAPNVRVQGRDGIAGASAGTTG